jgi:hypothetical protein
VSDWPYDRSIFVNCPFDRRYRPMLRAIMFAIHDCGYFARSALEVQDSSDVRFQKIVRIIRGSQYAIHDISRVQLDHATRLPRFNMPLELGLFLGAKEFGDVEQRTKRSLVLDRTPYRYQKFCSDIAGQDIEAHADKPSRAIELVRNWLSGPAATHGSRIPGGAVIAARYAQFVHELPEWCERQNLVISQLTYGDNYLLISDWLKTNPVG